MTTKIRSYSELICFDNFEDRYEYLRLGGIVGQRTFGSNRYLNQIFYGSPEWRTVRNKVIIRDNGCDLGVEGYDLKDRIYVHHMNPVTINDILYRNPIIFDLDNLICVSFNTHEAIHYGDKSLLCNFVERKPGDTTLWTKRRNNV